MIEYDLHVHTLASDGTDTLEEIIKIAERKKLSGLAITDHDSVKSLTTIPETSLTIIPGVELSCELDEQEVHILGYYIDIYREELTKLLANIHHSRNDRIKKMVTQANDLGMKITIEDLFKIVGNSVPSRPHLATLLLEKSYVSSIKEAFEKYLHFNGPLYAKRFKLSPLDAITLIKNCGGIPVVAHPGLLKNDRIIFDLIKSGLQGIEVFYPQHTKEQENYYYGLAKKLNLLITGGSDYHVERIRKVELGASGINKALALELFSKLKFL